jgi:hypothetical protein
VAIVVHLVLVFISFLALLILAVWGIRALWRMIRGMGKR